MAIDPLAKRLDSMAMEPAGTPSVKVDLTQMAAEELPPDLQERGVDEPYQVAGLGSLVAKGSEVVGEKAKRAIEKASDKLSSSTLAPSVLRQDPTALKTERPILQPKVEQDTLGPYQVVRDADPAKAEQVLEQVGIQPGGVKPSVSTKEALLGVPEGPINTQRITGEGELKQYIEAIALQAGADKVKTMTFDDVRKKVLESEFVVRYKHEEIGRATTMEEAQAIYQKKLDDLAEKGSVIDNPNELRISAQQPYDEAFLNRIIDPSVATTADPKELYKVMLAVTDAGNRAMDLGRQVTAAKAAGSLTPELAAQFRQAVAVEGALIKGLKRRQVDIARTLGIFRMAREGSAERGQYLDQLMSESGGIETIHDLAKKYTALDSRVARQAVAVEGALIKGLKRRQVDIARTLGIFRMAREGSAERGKYLDQLMSESGGIETIHDLATKYTALDSRVARQAVAEKTLSGTLKDIWMTTWYNGMLSSPVTHMKNIVGNLMFGLWQIPEAAVASGIGKVRNKFFGGEMAIQANEVHAQAFGFFQGMLDGAIIASRAMAKNTPTDPLTKIEMARSGRDAFDIDFGDGAFGKAFSRGLKFYGSAVTVPGRALMAEDEFFKAMAYRMELNALAARNANVRYREIIDAGGSIEDAEKASQELAGAILREPPAEIDAAAKSASRTVTFTRELERGLQQIEQLRNVPVMGPVLRLFMPFIRTPTNIMLEGMARIPGLNFASPRFWADFNKGGIARDKAVARVTLGGGVIGGASLMSYGGFLTGAGPFNYKTRQALEGTGWQAHSFVLPVKDVSEEQLAKFREITKVNVGPDKVYISYAGLEPLSSLLTIAATSAEYGMTAREGEGMEQVALGASIALYEYLGEQAMLSGFGEIAKIFQSRGSGNETSMLLDMMSAVIEKGGDFLVNGSPVGAYQSAVATWERTIDPTKATAGREQMQARDDVGTGAVNAFYKVLHKAMGRRPILSGQVDLQLDPITGEDVTDGSGSLYEAFSPFRIKEGKLANGYEVLVKFGVPVPDVPQSIDGVLITEAQRQRIIRLATGPMKIGRKMETMADTLQRVGNNPSLNYMYENPEETGGIATAQGVITSVMSSRYSAAKQMLLAEDDALRLKIQEIAKSKETKTGKY